jgi:hypothetical protein
VLPILPVVLQIFDRLSRPVSIFRLRRTRQLLAGRTQAEFGFLAFPACVAFEGLGDPLLVLGILLIDP